MAKNKKEQSKREQIIKLLEQKATLKQDVFYNTIRQFNELKEMLHKTSQELNEHIKKIDKRVMVEYKERSDNEVELRVAGDVMIFHMHTNVFEFDNTHPIWKTSYVKEDESRSYCGMIVVYNFLSDSFKYNRVNDIGYMIARIFINNDNHYFVEGKRQLGFLYNDFVNHQFNREAMMAIIESTVLYALDFDLFTPPFDSVNQITVNEIQEAANSTKIATGKRLGFRFQADSDGIQ
jgi:hypothetical protein